MTACHHDRRGARRFSTRSFWLALLSMALPIAAGAVSSRPARASEPQVTRFPTVREALVRDGFFALDGEGKPVRGGVFIDMVYEKGHRRAIGGRNEELNLYLTRGGVAVPYTPDRVIAVLSGFDGYKAWAMTGLNDIELHPEYPKATSWNFDILAIQAARGLTGIELDLQVLKFGRGSVVLKERERHDGGRDGPSVIHLTLGGKNLFVKHFTFTFFIFPLPDAKGSAIWFECECGLRNVVDWFFRDAAEDTAKSTEPRVGRFLENAVGELERRAAAEAATTPKAPPVPAPGPSPAPGTPGERPSGSF